MNVDVIVVASIEDNSADSIGTIEFCAPNVFIHEQYSYYLYFLIKW